jgi:hypothetical protein
MELNESTGVSIDLGQCDNEDEVGLRSRELKTLYRLGWEASLAKARQVAYRQGYRDGFADGFKRVSGTDAAAGSEKNLGTAKLRLKGLPCTGCGYFYYSDLAECPHCKAPKTAAAQCLDPSQIISLEGE